jgi:hypothetical protein
MARDEAYKLAEQKIAAALKTGAMKLDLPHWFMCCDFIDSIQTKGSNHGA